VKITGRGAKGQLIDEPRLDDRHPGDVFRQLAAKAEEPALLEFVGALSALASSGTWAALRSEVKNSVAKSLLASTLAKAGIDVGVVQWRAGSGGSRDHAEYVERSFMLRVRLTDTQDPIILRHLPKKRTEQCLKDPDVLRNEIAAFKPILFIVAGTGLVYWDKDYCHLDYVVSQTAISLPLSQLEEYIEQRQDCVIEFADFEPAPSKRRPGEVADLIAAFAVRHTSCTAMEGAAVTANQGTRSR
jgi:hypothetical protein